MNVLVQGWLVDLMHVNVVVQGWLGECTCSTKVKSNPSLGRGECDSDIGAIATSVPRHGWRSLGEFPGSLGRASPPEGFRNPTKLDGMAGAAWLDFQAAWVAFKAMSPLGTFDGCFSWQDG